VATEDIRRIALAILAVFAAHTLSLLVTEPARTKAVVARGVPVAAEGNVVRSAVAAARKRVRRATQVREVTKTSMPKDAVAATDAAIDLGAYEGLGSWVDLFNHGPWRNPSWTVRRMAKRGVRTIYLQTSTYGSPAPVVYPSKVAEFIASAHRRDMTVVGWSVPSFTRPERDFWRSRAGLLFETGAGERFDSFAVDIEADILKNIGKRNHRLIELSKRLRKVAGKDYPLGAIIPDPGHSLYWPNFPYKRVVAHYDVMVPMGYFTFRTHGFKNVRNYTTTNIKVIRREAGKKTPIHVIGGIADDVGVSAARGFIKAIKKHGVLGASLYDFPITSDKTWKELSAVPHPGG
jgi:hypothetical protein